MTVKFISREDTERIVDSLSSDFFELTNVEKEFKKKGIKIIRKNMNINELINRLELLRKEHGELEVTVNGDELADVDFDCNENTINIEGVNGIFFNPDYD